MLNILLENDVKDKLGNFEGVYTFQGFSNGMDYWVHAEGEYGIWYVVEEVLGGSPINLWVIGPLSTLGYAHAIKFYTFSNNVIMEKKCPNNEGHVVWSPWMYTPDAHSFVATNDVYIKCANENDFCTYENPCGTDQGDCDTHDECQTGLFCGSNNCPVHLGYHSEFDCCYATTVGDEYFCTTDNPCEVDEGDCDSFNECQGNLICDIAISCPAYLGFASDVNCCSSASGCKSLYIIIIVWKMVFFLFCNWAVVAMVLFDKYCMYFLTNIFFINT